MNPLVILSGGKDALLARETFVTDLYIYIYIYIYLCMVLTNVTRILPLCFQQAGCLKSIFYCNCNSVYKIWCVSYDVTLKVTGLTFTCDHK